MSFIIDPTIHLWFSIIVMVMAIISFAREKISLELTSIALLTALLLFGQFFPLYDANGYNQLNASELLAGFANPSLIAVLTLLVMGQGMIQTDALGPVTRLFYTKKKFWAIVSIVLILLFVLVVSAFMNNTPLVILAIPILQTLCTNLKFSESKVMIPLSFAAILGGMTTLIGSSTNLLVSSAMQDLGYKAIGFFDFTVAGAMLAGVGFLYVLFVLPRMMPDRSSMTSQIFGKDKKEFVAELDIDKDSPLIGEECVDGYFPSLPNIKIRLIQRYGHIILPPFEGYSIEAGDIIIVAATREDLATTLAKFPGFVLSESTMQEIEEKRQAKQDAMERQLQMAEQAEAVVDDEVALENEAEIVPKSHEEQEASKTRILAEVMIAPASRLIDMSLEQAGFQRQYGVIVLGIQRRARVVRRRLGRVRLEDGDVLLIAGSQAALDNVRDSADFMVMAGSVRDLPLKKKAPVAAGIFVFTIAMAALSVMPIPVAAITGAVLMLATGCLNFRQAVRALDRKIFLLVGAALALGTMLEVSNAAGAIASSIMMFPYADEPLVMVSLLFIIVAIMTNLLSNNACAILFTPIAMNLGANANIDPMIMASTVIFGANCSFASPIGYQTNLMVMGPGHYRFKDFMVAGIPLILVLWVAFIGISKFYYGL